MESPIVRHRHEIKRRQLTIREKSYITPRMLRIEFEGGDLADFVSLSPDDHVKLIIAGAAGNVERRDYTPRYFDRAAGTLTIDFAVHDAGPATLWAIGSQPGDVLEVGGPRGSAVISPDFAWWLLIGDETALPAIGRRLEEMPQGKRAISVVAVADAGEEQSFETRADLQALWVHRPLDQADAPASLLSALQEITLPEGDGFVWIAAEARVARAVRDYLVNTRGHPLQWTKAAGYWLKGVADADQKSID
jgi:NADPH-dependent ferric siderophore reductase